MKKLNKVLIIFLTIILLIPTVTSCNKVKFNFDDKYFIGMQEHFYEIRNMEPSINTDFICDLNGAIGAKVFRINVTLNNLFYVDRNDTVKFNESTKAQFHICNTKLIESGVERIVYANDSFLYPYGYSKTHEICVPDPSTERESYERWLKVNSTAYGMIAKEFPEVDYFEPINEPDHPTGEVLCKNGMIWGAGDHNFMYTEKEEANILADLCYYIRREIKAVDSKNIMMTPALTSLKTTYSYLESIYEAIESGAHPIMKEDAVCVDPDEYFDIIDIHPYAFVSENVNLTPETEEGIYLINDDYVTACTKFYDICVAHGDAEKPHWYTEIGFTDQGLKVKQEVIGREVTKQLQTIKKNLKFVECVIFYKMCDFAQYNIDINENNFGLLPSPANPKPYATSDVNATVYIKPIFASIYSYMHNGSKDYSKIYEVFSKYSGGNN